MTSIQRHRYVYKPKRVFNGPIARLISKLWALC